MNPIITPLLAEQMHSRDLDRELEKCRQELVAMLERFEDLQRQKEQNQAALREMRRTWPS